MIKKCSICKFLKGELMRNGFLPICKYKVYKFKERIRLDWENDKDINTKSCNKFIHFNRSK